MKKFFLTILLFSLISSCGSVSEGFKLKKGNTGDEFLVEKKNPLTEPPDMNELPVPLDQEEEQSDTSNEDSLDIEKVLKVEQSEDSNNQNQENSLEKTILEKINN